MRKDGDTPDDGAESSAVTDVPEGVLREVTALMSDDPSVVAVGGETTGDLDPIVADLTGGDDSPTPPMGVTRTLVIEGADHDGFGSVIDIEAGGDDNSGLVLVGGDDSGVLMIDASDAEVTVIDADDIDRVVIVDDDKPDPRFEERRQRNERIARLRKFRWVRLGVYAGIAVAAVMAVLASPLFAVRSVDVEGVVYADETRVAEARDALLGASVFTVDRRSVERILLADPWVADVRISTSIPSSALIEIEERVPTVWYVGADNKARVVDLEGHVVQVLDGWPTDYTKVEGVGPNLEPGARADDVYRAAAQLVTALPDELKNKVRSAGVEAVSELTLILRSGTIVRFGPPTDLQNKLVAVVVLLRRLDPANLSSIDVSTGEATYLTR